MLFGISSLLALSSPNAGSLSELSSYSFFPFFPPYNFSLSLVIFSIGTPKKLDQWTSFARSRCCPFYVHVL